MENEQTRGLKRCGSTTSSMHPRYEAQSLFSVIIFIVKFYDFFPVKSIVLAALGVLGLVSFNPIYPIGM